MYRVLVVPEPFAALVEGENPLSKRRKFPVCGWRAVERGRRHACLPSRSFQVCITCRRKPRMHGRPRASHTTVVSSKTKVDLGLQSTGRYKMRPAEGGQE